MKTLVTLLKLAMLVTTLSFVMSCDKANKKTNNTAVNSIYTYGANGSCINNQTGQQVQVTLCQQQYQGGYGSQQCNGNANLYVWVPMASQYDQYGQMCGRDSYGQVISQNGYCWKSCQNTNCSGQMAYQGNVGQYNQGGNQFQQQQQTQPIQCL